MDGEGVLSVHQGKSVQLECRARGDEPISITWRKGGADLRVEPGRTTVTVVREVGEVGSRLEISDAKQTDSGRYECQVKSVMSHFYLPINAICHYQDSLKNGRLLGVQYIPNVYKQNYPYCRLKLYLKKYVHS